MYQCKDLHTVWQNFIDKTVRIDKDFSDILVVYFRDNPSDLREIIQFFGFINDILRYLAGVIFGILRDIVMDVP